MARIKPLTPSSLPPAIQVVMERSSGVFDIPLPNSKATLAHSLVAFESSMQWYPLYEEVEKVLGNRLAAWFAYSISKASDCQVCSAFFRKNIVQAGDDPDHPLLTTPEMDVVTFGKSIVLYHGHIRDFVYNTVAARYSDPEMVILIAFAGQILAVNIFNNTAETEIDEHLKSYLPTLHQKSNRI